MGSISDLEVMQAALKILDDFKIDTHKEILSAHRTPEAMLEFGKTAAQKGFAVIIAGAGGAAHLPGMLASASVLPVIGVPIKSSQSIQGIDSLLSIVQMPSGVPVATVGINASANAGILAAQILGIQDAKIHARLLDYKKSLVEKVAKMNGELCPSTPLRVKIVPFDIAQGKNC